MEESLVRIDALMKAEVVPGHSDLVGEIDKHLHRVVPPQIGRAHV